MLIYLISIKWWFDMSKKNIWDLYDAKLKSTSLLCLQGLLHYWRCDKYLPENRNMIPSFNLMLLLCFCCNLNIHLYCLDLSWFEECSCYSAPIRVYVQSFSVLSCLVYALTGTKIYHRPLLLAIVFFKFKSSCVSCK